jgi:MFS superfamily sulfate permease-like transporter
VAIGVVVTLILVLRELNVPKVRVLGLQDGVLGVHLERGLYTANALVNERKILEIADGEDVPVRALVLGLTRQEVMTITVLDALESLDRELSQRGTTLHLAALPAPATAVAERTPWFVGLRSAGRVHDSVREGIASAEAAARREAAHDGVHPGELDDGR